MLCRSPGLIHPFLLYTALLTSIEPTPVNATASCCTTPLFNRNPLSVMNLSEEALLSPNHNMNGSWETLKPIYHLLLSSSWAFLLADKSLSSTLRDLWTIFRSRPSRHIMVILSVCWTRDLDRHNAFLVCGFHRADPIFNCVSFAMTDRTEVASHIENKTELRIIHPLLDLLRFSLHCADKNMLRDSSARHLCEYERTVPRSLWLTFTVFTLRLFPLLRRNSLRASDKIFLAS